MICYEKILKPKINFMETFMTKNPWIQQIEITGTFKRLEDLPELDVEQLLKKAAKAFESAKNEITYGETIRDLLAAENEPKECHRSLTTIGVWHFECGIELFSKAARNLVRAKNRGLTEEMQKEVETQIKECRKQLEKANKQKDSAKELLDFVWETGKQPPELKPAVGNF